MNLHEPHLLAICNACRTSLSMLNELPETDTVLEIKSVLEMQKEILSDFLNGQHFGSRALHQFILYCHQTCEELEKLEKE